MVRLLLMALLKAAYYLCAFIDYSTQKKADTEGGKRVMKYDTITRAAFIKQPNRFVAEVDIDGKRETVHVKNTGRGGDPAFHLPCYAGYVGDNRQSIGFPGRRYSKKEYCCISAFPAAYFCMEIYGAKE